MWSAGFVINAEDAVYRLDNLGASHIRVSIGRVNQTEARDSVIGIGERLERSDGGRRSAPALRGSSAFPPNRSVERCKRRSRRPGPLAGRVSLVDDLLLKIFQGGGVRCLPRRHMPQSLALASLYCSNDERF